MRTSAFVVVVATVLVSLLAVSESGVLNSEEIENRGFIDPIIRDILEKMRPKFANLKIDDIDEVIKHPDINATFKANNIIIKNLDQFVIQVLKSSAIPLRLSNLTLTWTDIVASASYDFNVIMNAPKLNGPLRIYGKGDAKAVLSNVFFTIGANMELKNKAIQIKPRGLFGFDLAINNANVTLTSIMGSTEFGDALGVFIGKIIPDLVNTMKKPVFDAFQDDIIRILNEIFAKGGINSEISFDDEYFLNSSEESDEYFSKF